MVKFNNRILIFIVVLLSFGAMLPFSTSVLKTSHTLWRISCEITDLTRQQDFVQPGTEWGLESIQEYNKLLSERKALQESQNSIVSYIASNSDYYRTVVILLAILIPIGHVFILAMTFIDIVQMNKKRIR